MVCFSSNRTTYGDFSGTSCSELYFLGFFKVEQAVQNFISWDFSKVTKLIPSKIK